MAELKYAQAASSPQTCSVKQLNFLLPVCHVYVLNRKLCISHTQKNRKGCNHFKIKVK